METTPAIEPPESIVVQRYFRLRDRIGTIAPLRRFRLPGGSGGWRRYGVHLAVMLVALTAIFIPRFSLSVSSLALPQNHQALTGREYLDDARPLTRGERPAAPLVSEDEVLRRAGVMHTTEALYPELQARTYAVADGDTLYGIAARYDLDLKTVIWANDALVKSPDSLSIGQELVILPLDGAYYAVAEGDTIESIAEKYKVSSDAILNYGGNEIEDGTPLTVGMKLVIPGADLPEPPPRVIAVPAQERTYTARVVDPQEGSGSLIWPVSGRISQGYSGGHAAVDIAGDTGSPVVAADDGTVVLVSWMTWSYGYHIIIDHGNGLETLYGHLSEIDVEVGENVSKGEVIGKRGSTGRSTGPHLHFEVREGGVRRNPFNYLP